MMKRVQILNGYRLLYEPNHPRAMFTSGYNGYVYEHIKVAIEMLGRDLEEDEVVHHLDGNRANNRYENLLVLKTSQHNKLHAWLSRTEKVEPKYCKICQVTLQDKQVTYCSNTCRGLDNRKVPHPSKEQLAQDIEELNWCAIGRKYGVSDNAVRKWARKYGLI